MTALTLNDEFGLMRLRFRRTLALSLGLHVLFFGWLLVSRQFVPVNEPVVEITWLDQTPSVVKPVPPEIRTEPEPAPPVPKTTVKEKLAASATQAAEVRRKLAALQPSPVTAQALTGASATVDLVSTARAAMAPVTRPQAPANLNRGPTGDQAAAALTRGPVTSPRSVAVVADLPPGSGGGAAAATPDAGSTAVRNLGGATLKGLVADRRVLVHTMPAYPVWATDQAVEATVTLYFLVTPAGVVRENVQVQTTAGYEDFDLNAVRALRHWRFEPLTGAESREQWGTITFRYRLHD